MKVLILGATGNLGSLLLDKATARGHRVTALVRTPGKVALRHPALEIVAGDVRESADVVAAVGGQQAVINAVGGDGDIRHVAVVHLIEAMGAANISRLINLGGAGILTLGPCRLYRLPVFPKEMVPVTLKHLKVYEELQTSGLDWTLVCPPFMAPAASSGGYQAKADHPYVSAAKEVPLIDVADFILDELAEPRFIGKLVGIRKR